MFLNWPWVFLVNVFLGNGWRIVFFGGAMFPSCLHWRNNALFWLQFDYEFERSAYRPLSLTLNIYWALLIHCYLKGFVLLSCQSKAKAKLKQFGAMLFLFHWNVSGLKTCHSPTTFAGYRTTFYKTTFTFWVSNAIHVPASPYVAIIIIRIIVLLQLTTNDHMAVIHVQCNTCWISSVTSPGSCLPPPDQHNDSFWFTTRPICLLFYRWTFRSQRTIVVISKGCLESWLFATRRSYSF